MIRPSYQELCSAPELAILAALEHALGLAILSLAVQYPELQLDMGDDPPSDLLAASNVIDVAQALHDALNTYSRALSASHQIRSDDIPF